MFHYLKSAGKNSVCYFNLTLMRSTCFLLLFTCTLRVSGQNIPNTSVTPSPVIIENINRNSTIWQGSASGISIEKIAAYAAPVLWFSPDEPYMKDFIKKGIHIPEEFPFEKPTERTVRLFLNSRLLSDHLELHALY